MPRVAFYVDPDHSIINIFDEETNRTQVVEAGTLMFEQVLATMPVEVWKAPPPPPPPTPDELRAEMPPLNRMQVLAGLVSAGALTLGDAAQGVVPPGVADALAAIEDDAERTRLTLTWATFQRLPRLSPMTAILAQATTPPMTDDEIDAFWETAAAF